jgi:hypothetical protein
MAITLTSNKLKVRTCETLSLHLEFLIGDEGRDHRQILSIGNWLCGPKMRASNGLKWAKMGLGFKQYHEGRA